MYYAYATDAGTFVLERQGFTESAWQLVFNGTFIDSYSSPHQAARHVSRHAARLGLSDPILLPPASLSAWEVRWAKRERGEACELWLHQMYAEGRAPAAAVTSGHRRPARQHTSAD